MVESRNPWSILAGPDPRCCVPLHLRDLPHCTKTCCQVESGQCRVLAYWYDGLRAGSQKAKVVWKISFYLMLQGFAGLYMPDGGGFQWISAINVGVWCLLEISFYCLLVPLLGNLQFPQFVYENWTVHSCIVLQTCWKDSKGARLTKRGIRLGE